MSRTPTASAVYTLTAEDFQGVAKERLGRELTEDELQSAVHHFGNGVDWCEYAEVAIDCAVEKVD